MIAVGLVSGSVVVHALGKAGEVPRISVGGEHHIDTVRMLALSPSRRRIASAAADHTVKIWNVFGESVVLAATLKQQWAHSLVWLSDTSIAIGTLTRDIIIADVEKESCTMRGVLSESRGACFDLAVDWGLGLVASASLDNTARVWRLPGLELQRSIDCPAACCTVAFRPHYNVLALGLDTGEILIRSLGVVELDRSIAGHTGRIRGLAFSGSGNRLASASSDQTVRVFDFDSGDVLVVVPSMPGGLAASVSWLPGDSQFAVADENGLVLVDPVAGARISIELDSAASAVLALASPWMELSPLRDVCIHRLRLPCNTGVPRDRLPAHVRAECQL